MQIKAQIYHKNKIHDKKKIYIDTCQSYDITLVNDFIVTYFRTKIYAL